MKRKVNSPPVDIPKELVFRAHNFEFRVVRFDAKTGMYVCVTPKGSSEFQLKKTVVERVFQDLHAN